MVARRGRGVVGKGDGERAPVLNRRHWHCIAQRVSGAGLLGMSQRRGVKRRRAREGWKGGGKAASVQALRCGHGRR
eukprot:217233-Chlamydomonas_euryale.AAC.1